MTQEITLVAREFDGFRRALAKQSAAWRGGDVNVRYDTLPELEQQVVDGAALTDGSADLALVPTDWLPALIDRGAVVDLSERLAAKPPTNWPGGWATSMRGLQSRNHRIYGTPYHDGPMVVLYRSDLYSNRDEREAYSAKFGSPLRPPHTWSEFAQQAQWFTRPELYGTVLAGHPDGHNDLYDFLLQLWSRGGQLARHGQAAFHEAAGISGLEYLLSLRRQGLVNPASLHWDSVESGERFAAGEAALMVNWAGFAAMSSPESSPTHGRVACAPAPRHDQATEPVSLNVYWVLVLAAGSRHTDAAYSFLRHLMTPEMDLVTSLEGATGTRLSTWRDPRTRELSPYYAVIEEVHQNVVSPPSIAAWPQAAAGLSEAIAACIHDGAKPAPTLAAAADRVNQRGWFFGLNH